MSAETIRARVYESDPLLTWITRVSDEWDDYYELPAELVSRFERAERALDAARDAVTGYIAEHKVRKVCPWDER